LIQATKDKADKHDPALEWIGYILLTVSVIVDALFADSQAFCKATFKPTGNQLFTITNFYTFVICLLFSAFGDQTLIPSIKFLINYPRAMLDIVMIGALQVIGQISIYYIVANFKQHVFPLISTTRKILTVIISIFIFDHSINNWQWVAIGLVFVGMFY
jgi:UDP-galactose transporter B1